MQVVINLANNLKQSALLTFENIKQNPTQLHYVIVPDRFSVTVEKQILKQLNKNCSFNVEVLPLSRLCNRFIQNENKKLLSKNQSIMLIKKCILKNANKLECFKYSCRTDNFGESIFETIMQLKSCNITPQQLSIQNEIFQSLNIKLNDIKLIYEEYEKELKNNYIDSFNKLNLFCENMFKYNSLKQYNIHFVYFNAFTPLILKVINSLIKYSKSVSFALSCAYPNQNNAHIYTNQTLNDVLVEAQSLDVQPTINWAEKQQGLQEFLRENLYSYCNKTIIGTPFSPLLLNFSCIQNEVKYICADIKKKVIENNLRYNKFTIACANAEQYFDLFKNELKNLKVPFFIDQSQNLSQTVLWRLIDSCINYFLGDNLTIFDIADNPILKIEENNVNTFKNFCKKYNIKYNFNNNFKYATDPNLEIAEQTRQQIWQHLCMFEQIKQCKNAQEYCFVIENYIKTENFVNLYNDFLSKLNITDKLQYQIEQQAMQKFEDILSNINSILEFQEISFKEWYEILLSGVVSCNISTLPLSVDCVFVGDVNNSVFDNSDYLYICGATQQSLPITKQDLGIISDYEIEKLNQKLIIEPTIRTINQRARLKCIELISSYNVSLTISYSILDITANANTASEIIKQISQMIHIFNEETQCFIPLPILSEEMLYINNNQSLKDICYSYASINNCATNIVQILKQNQLIQPEDISNYNALYNYLYKNSQNFNTFIDLVYSNEVSCKNANQIFFKNNNTSISEIESYFSCPFKHFMQYGLKLQKNQDSSTINKDIGNILHGVAEKFIKFEKNYDFNIDTNKIPQISEKFFYESVKDNKLEFVVQDKDNALLIKDLLQESTRFCYFLHDSTQKTNFKPTYIEQIFGNSAFKEIDICIDNKKYNVTGKIDRVDVFNNEFRIIDYKTGSTSFDLKNLYYGDKVQLFIYQKAIADQFGQIPVGVFYLPVSNKFSYDGETSQSVYKLDGLVTDNLQSILDMDLKLNENNLSSKFIPATIVIDKKTNEISIKKVKNVVKSEDLLKLSQYAYEICKKALSEMQDNFIQPKPLQDGIFCSCSMCEYSSICKFNLTTDPVRTKDKNVSVNIKEDTNA